MKFRKTEKEKRERRRMKLLNEAHRELMKKQREGAYVKALAKERKKQIKREARERARATIKREKVKPSGLRYELRRKPKKRKTKKRKKPIVRKHRTRFDPFKDLFQTPRKRRRK